MYQIRIKVPKVVILPSVLILLIVFGALAGVYAYRQIKPELAYMNIPNVTKQQLDELDLDGYNHLMIVAHPDDEFLWGGGHLIEDDYLVVCLTNGDNPVRKEEYRKALELSGDKALHLSYPDLIRGKRCVWDDWEASIALDLKTIISYKNWESIVTHSSTGETGHKHHKYTHKLVNQAYEQAGSKAKQYYFGKYYNVEDVPEDLTPIDHDILLKKKEYIKVYVSEWKTVRRHYHMVPYELWEEKTA